MKNNQGPVRVFIADDHEFMRLGIRQYLLSQSGYEICGEASNSMEALYAIPKANPKIAIVDVQMPPTSGTEVIRSISKSSPNILFLAMSATQDRTVIARALNAGANGFFAKIQPVQQLKDALHSILQGHTYYPNSTIQTGPLSPPKGEVDDQTHNPLKETLSPREFEIFEMLGIGLRPDQIALRLSISSKTVNVHRFRMMGKMNLRHTQELSMKAYQWSTRTNSNAAA